MCTDSLPHPSAALTLGSNSWGERRSLPLWLSAHGLVTSRDAPELGVLTSSAHPSVQSASSGRKTHLGAGEHHAPLGGESAKERMSEDRLPRRRAECQRTLLPSALQSLRAWRSLT